MRVTTVFTCYNRKSKTEACIRTLVDNNPAIEFDFIVVDDGSRDGTLTVLESLKKYVPIYVIHGDGNLFYSGGMRVGLTYLMNREQRTEYVLLINDDVVFRPHAVENMIKRSIKKNHAIIAGATCDQNERFTYGPLKLINKKRFKYRKIDILETDVVCDSFNGNCVLIPVEHYKKNPTIDKMYTHTMGDYDYGFAFSRKGVAIYVSDEYIGECENNSAKGTWMDTSLSRVERFRKKESIKGSPTKQWWYYLRKNFGFFAAVRYTVSPFIRILIGK